MRLRNVANKEEILRNSPFLIYDGKTYFGKWHEKFENNHSIHLEIGMGKGQFLIEMAKKYPDINFVGIEKYDSVLARALEKIPKDLTNLYVIRGNANEIDKMFDHEIDTLYLNFSDPWPKKRHALRRLTSPIFLEKYPSLFIGDVHLYQRTDNKDLFTYSLVSFSQNGYLLQEVSLDLHGTHDDLITTEFEDKFTDQGLPIYYIEATKEQVKSKRNVK